MHQIASIPQYVLQYAPDYITDNELLMLIRLQIVPGTKLGIEQLAQMYGYKTVAPVTKVLNSLAERELIILNKNKVDPSPLYNTCLERICGKIEPPKPKPKEKKDTAHFILANELIRVKLTEFNEDVKLASILKSRLKKYSYDTIYKAFENLKTIKAKKAGREITWVDAILNTQHTFEDFKACVEYIESYKKTLDKTTTRQNPVYLNDVTDDSIQTWINGGKNGIGRKKAYQENNIFT